MQAEKSPPLSPQETLRLISQGRAEARRKLGGSPLLLYVPWGLAWLLGLGAMFLRNGPDGRVFVDMPEFLPRVILFGVMAIALLINVLGVYRGNRGLSGRSSEQGLMYGLAWMLGMTGVAAITGSLARFLPYSHQELAWTALITAAVGILYLAGAAVWTDWRVFVFGGWLIVSDMAGVWAGPGWHSLVVALAGGGGLIVFGVVLEIRSRMTRDGH
ncbi:hypothetical protein ACQP1K_22710 [Sphaerimonospora sp. CA-214678]|uniref:hypothetical protein n=1 Tax=Sphaerimonospora sp. CA-214678 TaxID=3240029 RepID=UPI003D8E9096